MRAAHITCINMFLRDRALIVVGPAVGAGPGRRSERVRVGGRAEVGPRKHKLSVFYRNSQKYDFGRPGPLKSDPARTSPRETHSWPCNSTPMSVNEGDRKKHSEGNGVVLLGARSGRETTNNNAHSTGEREKKIFGAYVHFARRDTVGGRRDVWSV